MPFVERDENKMIKGVYANAQKGYAEEELPTDHPEVATYLEKFTRFFTPRVTVTMAQARLALNAAGLLPKVQAAVDAAGGDAQIEWEYSNVVHRDSPLVKTLAAAISLPDEQIDALFADARLR